MAIGLQCTEGAKVSGGVGGIDELRTYIITTK